MKSKQAGFTLLEMMVALSIVAAAAIGTLGVFASSTRAIVIAKEHTQISRFVKNHLISLSIQEPQIGFSQGQYNVTYRWELQIRRYKLQDVSRRPVATNIGLNESAVQTKPSIDKNTVGLMEAVLTVESLASGQQHNFSHLLLSREPYAN